MLPACSDWPWLGGRAPRPWPTRWLCTALLLLATASGVTLQGVRRAGVVLADPQGFTGAGVTFDQAGPDLTLTTPQHRLQLRLGSLTATLDGQALPLSARPQYVGQIVMVPFEDVAAALDLTVSAEVRPEWGSAPPGAGPLAGHLRGFQTLSATGPLSVDQLRGGADVALPVTLPLGADVYIATCEAAVRSRLNSPATLQFVRPGAAQVYDDGDLAYRGRLRLSGDQGAVVSLGFTCLGSLDPAARRLYLKLSVDGFPSR